MLFYNHFIPCLEKKKKTQQSFLTNLAVYVCLGPDLSRDKM